MEHILDNAYTNWRVPLSPSTDNHSFKQILAKLGNTATPSVFSGKTTKFSNKILVGKKEYASECILHNIQDMESTC